MSEFSINVGNDSSYDSLLSISGNKETIQNLVKGPLSDGSKIDCHALHPLPETLLADGSDMDPYLDFVCGASLERHYLNDQMGEDLDMNVFFPCENAYLTLHPDLNVAQWFDSRDEFLKRYRTITTDDFKAFHTTTRPYSDFVGLLCLLLFVLSYNGKLKTVPEAFADREADYFKTNNKSCNSAKWQNSKEAFRQRLDPESQVFHNYRLEHWGAIRNPEGLQLSYTHDGTLSVTFTSLGGPADKIIRALSEKYPELIFTHSWVNRNDPREHGVTMYHKKHWNAA